MCRDCDKRERWTTVKDLWPLWGIIGFVVALVVGLIIWLNIWSGNQQEEYNQWVNDCISEGKVIVPADDQTLCLPRENAPGYHGVD